MQRILALIAAALCSVLVTADDGNAQGRSREAKIAIFVGAETRDGFVDIDQGIRDSIKDIQGELRHSRRFTLVPAANQAVIVLTVIGRRTPGTSGALGVPVGAVTMLFPIKRRAIDTILRVGTYDKATTSAYAVALHFVHYNFARIHKTLRVTPAMEAGLATTSGALRKSSASWTDRVRWQRPKNIQVSRASSTPSPMG